jgi:hypothetical protein
MNATHTPTTDPAALVRQLDADALRARIVALDEEREALLVLLRAAQRIRHRESGASGRRMPRMSRCDGLAWKVQAGHSKAAGPVSSLPGPPTPHVFAMNMLRDGAATSSGRHHQQVQKAHDPVLCGIDPDDPSTDCDACQRARAEADRAEIERHAPIWLRLWNRLRQRFALLQRASRTEQPPDPIPPKEFTGLVRALCEPQYREPFAAALAPEIFAIARQAVRAELAAERRAR